MPKNYPPVNFRVEIGGMPAGYFTEISGLGSEHEFLPSTTKWQPITLKKGYIDSDPLSHKVFPGDVAHKVSPGGVSHKINPASMAQKVNPASMAHKINPAGHKIVPDPLMQKVNPVAHKINPAAHKINPAGHKINPASPMQKVNPSPASMKGAAQIPGPAMSMKANAQIVLHGFVVDERCQHLLQHWVNPAAPKKSTPRGVIVMLDNAGRPVSRWDFENAWPIKVSGPSQDSGYASVALTIGKLTRG